MAMDTSKKVGGRRNKAPKHTVSVTRPRGKPIVAPGGAVGYKDGRGKYTGKESCK
jgi:hypothetical protein